MPASPSHLPARRRKAIGAYYTPSALVRLLLDHALHPGARDILDPASGPGDFLVPIRQRLPTARLVAVDIDPTAVNQCLASIPGIHAYHADALLSPPAALHPHAFDLVIGNPPFVNAIEGDFDHLKPLLRARYPDVRGAADLAHYFLRQAIEWVRPGGRVALVLPRSILNSPAAHPIRTHLPPHLHPNLIYAPERSDFFPAAAVFVCLLILGPESRCKVSTAPDPATANFRDIGPVEGDNWWQATLHHPSTQTPSGPPLADHFTVSASMTAGDAYDLLPHLIDSRHGPGLRFTTTGLIEPGHCVWGAKPCRYLRRDFHFPHVAQSPALTKSLSRRLELARRPKILVAGLARRLEAFLDDTGAHAGAVSTYSIFHPQDDIPALRQLLAHLLSPQVSGQLVRSLGANGLRGRHITVKKSFLRELIIPA